MPKATHWDPGLYEAQHSFVWEKGRELLGLLDAKPGEKILDLGCGTGQLSAEIAAAGAEVLGFDSSPEMIAQARQNFPARHHPNLSFTLAEAAAMPFQGEFDAIFSNAALHWMLDTAAVAKAMARALKLGGRFVVECGGKGNIGAIESASASVVRQLSGRVPDSRTVFHSIASFAAIFESSGFEIVRAELFERPTELAGERGMEQWLEQFGAYWFDDLDPRERIAAMKETAEALRPQLFRGSVWFADYRRLRAMGRLLPRTS